MTKYYLNREIEKARAKHKPIEIVLPDVPAAEGVHNGYAGRTISVLPPQLWPDEITVSAQVTPVQAARDLVGDANLEHWQAAGGTAGILFEIVRAAGGAESLGESAES